MNESFVARLTSSDAIVRGTALKEASRLGRGGAECLVSALRVGVRDDFRIAIVVALGSLGWQGAVGPIKEMLRSDDLLRDTSLVCASIIALGKLLGPESSHEAAGLLNDRRANVRNYAWQVIACVGDFSIVSEVQLAWESALSRLRKRQVTVRYDLPLILCYWGRHAERLSTENLLRMAVAVRGLPGPLPLTIERHWPELIFGNEVQAGSLLPSRIRINDWRTDSNLVWSYWPNDDAER